MLYLCSMITPDISNFIVMIFTVLGFIFILPIIIKLIIRYVRYIFRHF